MVHTGRADSLVHGRVEKVRVGEGEWASYYPLDHSTRLTLARYLTAYSTKLSTLVELYMLFRTRLFTAYSTNVN